MLILKTKALLAAMDAAMLAVERRNTIPILGALLAEPYLDDTGNLRLLLAGTTLDQRVEASIACEDGSDVRYPAFVIADPWSVRGCIAKAGAATVTISIETTIEKVPALTVNGKKLAATTHERKAIRLVAGDVTLNMVSNYLLPDDFPHTGKHIGASFTASIGTAGIRSLRAVSLAMSHEETRYYLNGVYLHNGGAGPWEYTAVATDGHRLHMAAMNWPDATGKVGTGSDDGIIIPKQAIAMLLRLAAWAKDAPIALSTGNSTGNAPAGDKLAPHSASMVRFAATAGDVAIVVTSKLIDGTFPNYIRVVPDITTQKVVTFETKTLRRAVDVFMAVQGERTRAMKMEFAGNNAKLSTRWVEQSGSAEITAPFTGTVHDMEVGFNARYMLSMLDALGTESVSLGVENSASPTSFGSDESDTFRGVLMPMRIA